MDQFPAPLQKPKKSLNQTVKQGVDKRLPGLSEKHREMVKDVLEKNTTLKKFDDVYHFEDLGNLKNPRTKSAWKDASPRIKTIFNDNPEKLTKQQESQINTAFHTHFRSANTKHAGIERVKTRIGPDIMFTQKGANPNEFKQTFKEFDGGKFHHTADTQNISDFARMFTLQQKPKTQKEFLQIMGQIAMNFGPTTPMKSGSGRHPILGRDGEIPVFPIMNHYAGQMVQKLGEDGDYVHAFEMFNKFKSKEFKATENTSLPDFKYRKRGVIKVEDYVQPPRKRPKKTKGRMTHSLEPVAPLFESEKKLAGILETMPTSRPPSPGSSPLFAPSSIPSSPQRPFAYKKYKPGDVLIKKETGNEYVVTAVTEAKLKGAGDYLAVKNISIKGQIEKGQSSFDFDYSQNPSQRAKQYAQKKGFGQKKFFLDLTGNAALKSPVPDIGFVLPVQKKGPFKPPKSPVQSITEAQNLLTAYTQSEYLKGIPIKPPKSPVKSITDAQNLLTAYTQSEYLKSISPKAQKPKKMIAKQLWAMNYTGMNKKLNKVQKSLAQTNPVPGKKNYWGNFKTWVQQNAPLLNFAQFVPNVPAPTVPERYRRKIPKREPQKGFAPAKIKIQKTGTPSFSKASTKSPPKIKQNKKSIRFSGSYQKSIILSAVNFYKLRKYRGKKYSIEKILEFIKKALDNNKSINLKR